MPAKYASDRPNRRTITTGNNWILPRRIVYAEGRYDNLRSATLPAFELESIMQTHLKDCIARRAKALLELAEHQPNLDAERVTRSMADGLDTLRNLMFTRIHEDVETNLGRDSMLLPVSAGESELAAKLEIESYQVALSSLAARQRGYVNCEFEWYVRWLGHLRLGDAMRESKYRRRIRRYLSMSDDEARLSFSRHLETVFPEASRAPLILYRLYPPAVRIVSAIAFGHHLEASELRNRQALWLAVISDCHECHGRPLDNGEQCQVCGNPLWSYHWLQEVD